MKKGKEDIEELADLNESSPKLRIDFIGMMFALAVAQVGLEIGDFFNNGGKILKHFYVLTHLALAIFIIASSWIGWQTSKSAGNKEPLKDSFSISFVILLIDLFLVICYFIFVRGVEKPIFGKENIGLPDSRTEIFWSMVIFVTYIIWDIFTKLIIVKDHEKLIYSIEFKSFFKRGWQAILCLILIYVFVKPMQTIGTSKSVILTDIALFSVFLLFRGFKTRRNFENVSKTAKILRISAYFLLPILGIIISVIVNNCAHA